MKLILVLISICTSTFSFANSIISEQVKKLKESTQIEDKISAANELSWEYTHSNTDSAEYYALFALEMLSPDQKNYQQNLSFTTGMLGIIYDIKGERDKALKYYQNSLEIKYEVKDSGGIASTYTNIGALFYSQNDYNKALNYFTQALKYEEKMNDFEGMEGSYVNIGVIYKNMNLTDSAVFFLQKADSINSLTNNNGLKATVKANLGSLHYQMKDYQTAKSFFKQAIEINRTIDNNRFLSIALENYAKILIIDKDLDGARKALNEALIIATKGNFLNTIKNIYEGYYELFLVENDLHKAMLYKDTFILYKDSIQNQDFNKTIQDIEEKYQTEKRKSAIHQLANDVQKEKSKNQILSFSLLLLLLFILALIVIAILIRKARVKLQQKNTIIEKALEEREILMREIHHRVKNNIQSIKSLLQLEKRRNKGAETEETLNKILLRIQAMTFIHDHIYQQDVLNNPDIKEYLDEFIHSIIISFGLQKSPHTVIQKIENASINIDQLISLGTILNEVITNSCKYGLKDNVLHLSISGKKMTDKIYSISICDKGKGKPEGQKKGFGSDLIYLMSKKINGEISENNIDGYHWELKFPLQ